MTAINVLVLASEGHVFADGGHVDGRRLARLETKVHLLADYDAAFAWSGPTASGGRMLHDIIGSGQPDLPSLIDAFDRIIAGGGWQFSAVLVGVHRGVAMGVTLEHGGRRHRLSLGSQVRSLPTDAVFDPEDVAGSGLAMMEDQRARHGVLVAGWCQHVVVRQGGFQSEILRRWDDRTE